MITILLTIYEHMKQDYDCMWVIEGDPGSGKSRFALNLLETWYRIILRQKMTPEHIKYISQDYVKWLEAFRTMKPYDMNIFDESCRSLDSLDFMTKVSKDLNKLFNVFRAKRFFSIIVLPNYFRLNKGVREDRLRGLISIQRRGEYKMFSKYGLKFVNGFNNSRRIKNVNVAFPLHHTKFPDYKGILLDAYMKQKNEGVDQVLNEVIDNCKPKEIQKKMTLVDRYKDEVSKHVEKGKTRLEIAKDMEISIGTVGRCIVAAGL